MGRLAGFSYLDVTRKLGRLGFEFYRAAKGELEKEIRGNLQGLMYE